MAIFYAVVCGEISHPPATSQQAPRYDCWSRHYSEEHVMRGEISIPMRMSMDGLRMTAFRRRRRRCRVDRKLVHQQQQEQDHTRFQCLPGAVSVENMSSDGDGDNGFMVQQRGRSGSERRDPRLWSFERCSILGFVRTGRAMKIYRKESIIASQPHVVYNR